MTSLLLATRMNKWFLSFFCLFLVPTAFALAAAPASSVTLTVEGDHSSAVLAPRFLGLSYEMSMVLPIKGRYYFSPQNQALIHTFQTLGIRSLRVGANAVDDPRIAVPQEKDIDSLFQFARAAGVKVIYSFRLKNGNPAEAARLAGYIAAHYADALNAFSIGNEPGYYKPYAVYLARWKPIYDAILQTVPKARFDGPSVVGEHQYGGNIDYIFNLARAIFPTGHLAMASDHYYFLGSGRGGEKDPPATRARFLSDAVQRTYQAAYADVGAKLAAEGVPYRIDELNSCFDGGAKGSSDTYASTLWVLDCTHWWAAHHILGMNYHTGESVGRDGGFAASNYAAFVRQKDGAGFTMRPQAYGFLAFSQGARGHSLPVHLKTPAGFNFDAYAYRDQGVLYLTLINKSYGAQAQPAAVALHLPSGTGAGTWQRMDLVEKDNDVASKTDVTLGGASVDSGGKWSGRWETIQTASSTAPIFQIAPASATILRFSP